MCASQKFFLVKEKGRYLAASSQSIAGFMIIWFELQLQRYTEFHVQ